MPEWTGHVIGKVRIEKYLARGGMAEVYLGTHLTLERSVAVKVLHSHIESEPDLLVRFQREAKVIASLRHPNIVQIFDFDTYEVFLNGEKIDLSLREFELLRFFVRSPNRVYDRLQILDLVWGQDTYVEPRTVDVHIRRLRMRIERDDANPELICTVRGVGYRFNERALES